MTNITGVGGFSMKDEAAGEIPVAFVVRSNGSEIAEDEIKKYISQQVHFTNTIGFFSFLLANEEFKDQFNISIIINNYYFYVNALQKQSHQYMFSYYLSFFFCFTSL